MDKVTSVISIQSRDLSCVWVLKLSVGALYDGACLKLKEVEHNKSCSIHVCKYSLLKLDGKIRSLRSQAPFCIVWSILHKSTVHVRGMFVHFLWGVKILVSSEKNMILSPKFSFINLMFMPWISEVEADTGKIYIFETVQHSMFQMILQS